MKHPFINSYFIRGKYSEENHTRKYIRMIQNYVQDITTCRILDVGCAYGNFLAQNSNPDSVGVDISEHAIEVAGKKIQRTLLCYDINQSEINVSELFDVITLFDVIEHLDNFIYLNKIIEKNLKQHGFLIVTTPNANALTRFMGSKLFTGTADETHTNLFTAYTLDFFLKRKHLSKVTLFTPYSFYFRDDLLTRTFTFGGQIFAIFQKM